MTSDVAIPIPNYGLTFDMSETAVLEFTTDENYESVHFCAALFAHDLVIKYGRYSRAGAWTPGVRYYVVAHSRSFLEEQAAVLRGFSNLTNVRVTQLTENPDETLEA